MINGEVNTSKPKRCFKKLSSGQKLTNGANPDTKFEGSVTPIRESQVQVLSMS